MRSLTAAVRGVREREGGLTLSAIAFGWFLTLGVRFLLPAILPQIKAAFDITNATAGLAITVVWACYGLMQFPAGVLVDRLDERTLLSVSLVLGGGSLAAIALAPVYLVFLLACALFGFSTGLFGTSRGIALSRFFTANQGRAFGVTLAAGSVGSAALPLLGGTLADGLGWRLVVGGWVPLFLLTAAGTWLTVPAGDAPDDDVGGTELSLGGLLATLRGVFADRAVLLAFVGLTVMLFTFQALTSFLPTYLIQEKGLSQGAASGLFALLFVAGAAFQLAGGDAADRYGTRPVVAGISVVGIGTLAALPLLGGVIALSLLVVVLSSRIAVAVVLNPYIIGGLPADARGTTWGLLRTLFFLVGATGSTVVGVLSDRNLFDESFLLLAGLTAVAAALFIRLPASEEQPAGR